MTAPLASAVPNLQAPAVDSASGLFLPAWAAFFRRFAAGAPPIQPVTVGASPLAFKAPCPGYLALGGGTGISATLTRGRVTVSIPGAVVPVAQGDAVAVTFTAAPTANFLPRVI